MIPATATPRPLLPPHDGVNEFIIPDSEAVYSPAYANFDIAALAQQQGGYLATYREFVEGEELTGPQIVQLVAERLSVGPRVLLTLLEMDGGWLTAHAPGQSADVINFREYDGTALYTQLYIAGTYMNAGYYGKLEQRMSIMDLPDWNRVRVAPEINPGTAAVQNLLARQTSYTTWLKLVGSHGFPETYRKLFGDPMHYAIEPLVPPEVRQPILRVPWSDGQMWFYTGGPHAAWDYGSPRAAVDLAPSATIGCIASPEFTVAVAAGRVVASEHGRVVLNLSGSAFQGNGWSLLYMHMANEQRIAKGAVVNTADRIGHPSCVGGVSTGTHLHLARMYNGQWISADGVLPLDLSGWQFKNLPDEYDGTAARGDERLEAATDHVPTLNGIEGEPPHVALLPVISVPSKGETLGITRVVASSGR